jgi:hypothetical protein
MLDTLDDDWLSRSSPVSFCRTKNEIREQSRLPFSVIAIEVSAYQVSGISVCGHEDVVSSNMPVGEKPIPSVEDSPSMNLIARLGDADGPHARQQNEIECNISHRR